jgi:immune inhibitor A
MRRSYAAVVMALVLTAGAGPLPARDTCPLAVDAAGLAAMPVPVRDRAALATALQGWQPAPADPRALPEPGARRSFSVVNGDTAEVFRVEAELRVAGERLAVWVERNAADSVNDASLRALVDAFDGAIYPQVRAMWGAGAAQDVDGDPRIYALFTRGLGTRAAAYFSSDNSAPAGTARAGNGHEMFLFNLDALGGDFPLEAVSSIVAHELQHLLRFEMDPTLDLWLNEGFSEYTALMLYGDNIGAARAFFFQPDTQLNTWAEDASLRGFHYGAALAFVSYVADRFGPELVRAWSDHPAPRGLIALQAALEQAGGPPVETVFADWTLTNRVSGLIRPDDEQGVLRYHTLPSGISASLQMFSLQIPYAGVDSASQYAADYLQVADPPPVLTVTLEAPARAALIPDGGANPTAFALAARTDMGVATLTRRVDLTGLSQATLRFRTWFDLEDSWDFGYVMASRDGGLHWEILDPGAEAASAAYPLAYGPGFTGESGGWRDYAIPLDAYAGGPVLLRFAVITDDGINQPGMALDDIALPELGYLETFEGECSGWERAGWGVVENHAPQRAWVQAVQTSAERMLSAERWLLEGAPGDALLTGQWRIAIDPAADALTLIIAPFAPLTTEPMDYALRVEPAS